MREPIWITSTTRMSLEFGRPYSTKPQPNPEHIGNFRLFLEAVTESGTWISLMDIRGFSIYKKADKLLIKCPSYSTPAGKSIAFVLLEPRLRDIVFAEIRKMKPGDFQDKYSREDWNIWLSAPIEVVEDSLDADPDVSDLRDQGDL